jgi:hypothetical protein
MPSTSLIAGRRLGLVVAVSFLLYQTAAVFAAAPRLIMFSGSLVQAPIVLDDWSENGEFMVALTPTKLSEVFGRPFLEVALFSSPGFGKYAGDARPIAALNPRDADQHARFHPWCGDLPGLVEFGPKPWIPERVFVISAVGLRILEEHGVPTRIKESGGSAAPDACRSAQRTRRDPRASSSFELVR